MTLIIIALAIWGTSALIRSAREKRAREQAQRIAYEQERIKREMREMKQRASEETAARIALEREQMRQRREQERLAKEQEKQAAQIAKHDEQIAKMQFQLDQACEDIDSISYKVDELQKYSEYLQTERDACVPGGKEYFKWQNKLSAVDDKIYRLNKQKAKAQFAKEQAQRKMSA